MCNQLLCAHRKYLLAYESVHAPRDLPPPDPPQRPVRQSAGARACIAVSGIHLGQSLTLVALGPQDSQAVLAACSILELCLSVLHMGLGKLLSLLQASATGTDPLAMLADVASDAEAAEHGEGIKVRFLVVRSSALQQQ